MTKKIRKQDLKERWEKVEKVLLFQKLPYMPKIIWTELISEYHNNPLVNNFGINKSRELVAWKYYWPSLWAGVKAYIKAYNIDFASKSVCYKFYGNL